METAKNLAIPVSEALLDAVKITGAALGDDALTLYREGRLTLSQSAELCGMDLYGFMALASQAGVPVIRVVRKLQFPNNFH